MSCISSSATSSPIPLLTLDRHSLAVCLSLLDLRSRFRACSIHRQLTPFKDDSITWQHSRHHVIPLHPKLPERYHVHIQSLALLDSLLLPIAQPLLHSSSSRQQQRRANRGTSEQQQQRQQQTAKQQSLKGFTHVTSLHLGTTFMQNNVDSLYGLLKAPKDASSSASSSSYSSSTPSCTNVKSKYRHSSILSLTTGRSHQHYSPTMLRILTHPRLAKLSHLVLNLWCDEPLLRAIERLPHLRYLEVPDSAVGLYTISDNIWHVIRQLPELETFVTVIKKSQQLTSPTTTIFPPLPPSLRHLTIRIESLGGLKFDNWLSSGDTLESFDLVISSNSCLVAGKKSFQHDAKSLFNVLGQFRALQTMKVEFQGLLVSELRQMMDATAAAALASGNSSKSVRSLSDEILHTFIDTNRSSLECDTIHLDCENYDFLTMKRKQVTECIDDRFSLVETPSSSSTSSSSLPNLISSIPLFTNHLHKYSCLTDLYLMILEFHEDFFIAIKQLATVTNQLKSIELVSVTDQLQRRDIDKIFSSLWHALSSHHNLEHCTLYPSHPSVNYANHRAIADLKHHPCESGITAIRHLVRLESVVLGYNVNFSMSIIKPKLLTKKDWMESRGAYKTGGEIRSAFTASVSHMRNSLQFSNGRRHVLVVLVTAVILWYAVTLDGSDIIHNESIAWSVLSATINIFMWLSALWWILLVFCLFMQPNDD